MSFTLINELASVKKPKIAQCSTLLHEVACSTLAFALKQGDPVYVEYTKNLVSEICDRCIHLYREKVVQDITYNGSAWVKNYVVKTNKSLFRRHCQDIVDLYYEIRSL